jgi:hypothetical protein
MTETLPTLPTCEHRGDISGDRVACASNRWMHAGTVPRDLCATCRYADVPLLDIRPLRVKPEPTPATGPGTELKAILQDLGLEPRGSKCSCDSHVAQMNRWGVAGCREHRDQIIGWLDEARQATGWRETLGAGFNALWKRATYIRIGDPIGSLINEAIRRAEEKPC